VQNGKRYSCILNYIVVTRALIAISIPQLAVVVASIARNRASLAIGNIVGSAISNILGAFSLGILFHERGQQITFDQSSRSYSLLLLVLSTFVTPVMYFSIQKIWLIFGILLIVFFAVYVGSVSWAISRGTLIAPVDSDDDSSDDDASEEDRLIGDVERVSVQAEADGCASQNDSSAPIMPAHSEAHTLSYHISYLFLGFFAICLAGYILSHAATTITDEFGISDVLFGVVILAIATTLPEKFVAVISGYRGHVGILVANTVGSNIFLLSLCLGIVMIDKSGKPGEANVEISELGVLWGSTLCFTLTVWFGGRFCRYAGAAMLIAYVAFIILEFTVIHDVFKE
jgi:Ca2+/Na+ antiporter